MATGEKRYRDFSDFLNLHFDCKVQKISLHAGFTCPNRDGSIGVGGCTYCNNQTFSPDYCHTGKSITSQLEEGIAFLPVNILKCTIWPIFRLIRTRMESLPF